jgi:hypothetical protein
MPDKSKYDFINFNARFYAIILKNFLKPETRNLKPGIWNQEFISHPNLSDLCMKFAAKVSF